MIEESSAAGEEPQLSRDIPAEKARVSRYYPLTNRGRLVEYCQALVYPEPLRPCRGGAIDFLPAGFIADLIICRLLQNLQYQSNPFKPNWYRAVSALPHLVGHTSIEVAMSSKRSLFD
jgi:hypothetical protein